MQGIESRYKRYVPVTTFTNEEGQVRPTSILWFDGEKYVTLIVDEVKDVRRMSSKRVGGDGICYTIRVGKTVTRLYFEDPKWFVEAKEPSNGDIMDAS